MALTGIGSFIPSAFHTHKSEEVLMALILAEFSPGKSGQVDAVRALKRLQARSLAAVGASFYIGAEQDFIRDEASQIALLRANYFRSPRGSVFWDGSWWTRRAGGVVVAPIGQSKHAKGLAADITFMNAAAERWFRNNSASERWNNNGYNFGEKWHKEYFGPTNGTAPASDGATIIDTRDEFDMANLAELRTIVREEIKAAFTANDSRPILYRNNTSGEIMAADVDEGFVHVFPSIASIQTWIALGLLGPAALNQMRGIDSGSYNGIKGHAAEA